MVDPRIYRALLVLVAFAVILFGFSLQSQPHAVGTSLSAGDFFASAGTTMNNLADQHPNRRPGNAADDATAAYVKAQFSNRHNVRGFQVSTQDFTARTADGTRVLENVYASHQGLGSGEIVVVASRDSARTQTGPDPASLSGTAVLLDLANALSGERLSRSVMLISTSGQIGAAGATELAHSLAGQQVDAVIVLGDLASAGHRNPVVVPWSGSDLRSPLVLVNTMASFVRQQTGITSPQSGLLGQLVRLAVPFSLTQQAAFTDAGLPSVLLSVSGDLPTTGKTIATNGQLANMGAAVLQTVNALDQGASLPAPSSYLMISGKVVPMWAVRLLILALILPVFATAIDALARTRRRGHSITRWVGWVLTGCVPFLVGLCLLLVARAANLFSAVPPGAVGAQAVAVTGGDVGVLLGIAALMALSFLLLRPLCLRAVASASSRVSTNGGRRHPETPAADAAAVSLTLVMCLLTLVTWALDPYAALLLVPALHLWLWLAQPGVRSRRWALALLIIVPVVPVVPVLTYYSSAYGLSLPDLVWSGALMVAGGAQPVLISLCWAVALGCLASALVIAARSVGAAVNEPAVTVRGPSTYAGPGSLGGTESALRR